MKAESIIQESENAAVTEETPSAPAEPYAAHPDAISETSETPMSEIRFAPSFAQALEKEAKDTVLSEDRKQWAEKAGKRLCGILQAKGIPTAFLGADPTPNGCLVRLKGDFKLKTKVIDDLREGLLSTESLNVAYSEAVPGEFHVFLASPERESVPMWNIWKSRKMERQGGINFDVAIGLREDDGRILYLNPLDKEPHTLIAGESGSGKSILVKMMLLDLAATNSSKLTRFYLIDPKEFLDYKPLLRLPHFGHDLALSKDQASAVKVLEYVNAEMERRKTVISNADCENIAQFNSQARKEERLPVLWVIHDELPSWTADKADKDAVYSCLTKLATQARAMSIYLILMAQRPDNEVFPMQVRANLGKRIALKLKGQANSMIALDAPGAETLLGNGHLIASFNGHFYHAQAPFLKSDEIRQAVDMIVEADQEWDQLGI